MGWSVATPPSVAWTGTGHSGIVATVSQATIDLLSHIYRRLRAGRPLWWVVLAMLVAGHGMARAGIDTGLSGDDNVGGPFQIGFNFRYYGQNFTQFYVSTNGLLQFSNPNDAYSNNCLPPSGSGLANTLFVFWDDLLASSSGQPPTKIHYQTIGSSPNRRLVMQWTNAYFVGSGLMGTFQAVLYENSGEVRMQYRDLAAAASRGSSATIGIQGPASQATQRGCNQADVIAVQQALSFAPDASGTNYLLNAAATYDFIDITGATPEAPTVVAQFVNGAPVWNWIKLPALNSYQIEILTDAGTTAQSATTVGDVSSYAWTSGFQSGVTYRARVRGSGDGGSTWGAWSSLGAPITVDQVNPTGRMLGVEQQGLTSVRWRYQAEDALSGVATIRLQIAIDAQFTQLVFDDLVVDPGAHLFTAAVPGQRLYGRIRATDLAGNVSADSASLDVLVLAPPVAAFEASPASGDAPLTVQFRNTSTGVVSSYEWDFGDGRSSSEASPTVRFLNTGHFTVKLHASGVGGSTEAVEVVTVTAGSSVQYRYDPLGRLVQVLVPGGSSAQYGYDIAGNISAIQRLAADTLKLVDFSPRIGVAGQTVTLYGSGFSTTATQNTVTFNGVAAPVGGATQSTLTVTVPAGASSGRIAVSNANGSTTSAMDFVVTAAPLAPTIVGFTPTVGTAGTVITISGTNFQASAEDNKVRIGTLAATVQRDGSSPTTTQLKVGVLGLAASGKISVTTPFGVAGSSEDFFALPGTVDPGDVEFKGRLSVNGPPVTVTTTAPGKKIALLFDGQAKGRLHLVTAGGTFADSILADVYQPDGALIETLVLSNDITADFSKLLLADGTYAMILSPAGNAAGNLQVGLVADVSGSIAIDADATLVNILRVGQDARYTFGAAAGQAVSVILSDNRLNDGTTNINQPISLVLSGPGLAIGSPAIAATSILSGAAGGSLHAIFPNAGTYTIQVSPSGLDKGSIALQVRSFSTGELMVDGSTGVTLAPGRGGRYRFNAEAGRGYGMALTALSFTPVGGSLSASLRKADGTELAICNFSANESCDFDPNHFTSSGTYLIDFVPADLYAATFNAILSKDDSGTLSLNATQATPVTIVREGQNARYRFTGAAGQSINLLLNANTLDDGNQMTSTSTQVYLYLDQSGSQTYLLPAPLAIPTGAAGTVDATLPQMGTYTVWIAPSGLDKGTIAVQVNSLTTGELTMDGSTAIALSAGQKARYSFIAEASKGYGLALTNLVFTPSGGTVTASLKKSDGTLLTSCEFSSNGSCDFGAGLFTSSAAYLVEFSTSASHAATFSAVLSQDIVVVIAVDASQPTPLTIAREGQNVRYTFSGTAGQLVSAILTNSVSTGSAAEVRLYAPSSPLANPIGLSTLGSGSVGATLDAVLPETGIYTLWITPVVLGNGLAVQVKSYVVGSLLVDGGTAVTLSAGRNARFNFTGEPGKGYGLALIGLTTVPAGGSVLATLMSADGSALASCSFSSDASCDLSAEYITGANTYLVDVNPSGLNSATFNLLFSKDTGGPITVGAAPTTVVIQREGQNARYTFSATAGQTVNMVLSANTLDDGNANSNNGTFVGLFRPSRPTQNAVVSNFLYSNQSGMTLSATLPETGTYTLWLGPTGLDKGTISLQVRN